MYDSIGEKIKGLAKIVCGIGIVASVLGGFLTILNQIRVIVDYGLDAMDGDKVFLGLFLAIFGSLVSWMSTWILYGFGELIEKVSEIERYMCDQMSSAQLQRSTVTPKRSNADEDDTVKMVSVEEFEEYEIISDETL